MKRKAETTASAADDNEGCLADCDGSCNDCMTATEAGTTAPGAESWSAGSTAATKAGTTAPTTQNSAGMTAPGANNSTRSRTGLMAATKSGTLVRAMTATTVLATESLNVNLIAATKAAVTVFFFDG